MLEPRLPDVPAFHPRWSSLLRVALAGWLLAAFTLACGGEQPPLEGADATLMTAEDSQTTEGELFRSACESQCRKHPGYTYVYTWYPDKKTSTSRTCTWRNYETCLDPGRRSICSRGWWGGWAPCSARTYERRYTVR